MINLRRVCGRWGLTRNLVLRRTTAVLDAYLQVTVGLQVALRPLLLVHYPPRRPEYLVVDHHHHSERYIKTTHRRVQLVAEVLGNQAHLVVALSVLLDLGVFVADDEQRGQRDAGREAPHQDHPEDHPLGRPLHSVLQRLGYGVVAIHADHAEVEDGRRAAEHIEAHPQVAHDLAEDPAAFDLVEHRHGHDQNGDAEVAHGQADE